MTFCEPRTEVSALRMASAPESSRKPLSGTGMFDASLATRIGGPYGLSAMLTGLALAAGARLANAIIPVHDTWPSREKLFHRAVYGLIGLGVLAYLGLSQPEAFHWKG